MILIIIFVIIRAYQRSARFQVHWIVHVIVQKEVDYIDREFFKTSVVSTKTKQKWLYRLATFFFWKAKKAMIIHTRIQPFKSNCSWTVISWYLAKSWNQWPKNVQNPYCSLLRIQLKHNGKCPFSRRKTKIRFLYFSTLVRYNVSKCLP